MNLVFKLPFLSAETQLIQLMKPRELFSLFESR